MCQRPSGRCNSNSVVGQPYPRRGSLSRYIDLPQNELRDHASASAQVYRYVVATVENVNGRFVQHGSGPNWQGGVLTLCTCKHAMRTFLEPENWHDVWIAGFSGVRAGGGRNALVYLTRITAAYSSHSALWQSPLLTQQAKRAKSATIERFGDIFEPRDGAQSPYAARNYQIPCADHVHDSIITGTTILTILALTNGVRRYWWAIPHKPIFGSARHFSCPTRSVAVSARAVFAPYSIHSFLNSSFWPTPCRTPGT